LPTSGASEIDRLVAEGYISRKKHPDLDLFILNYTPRAQYEKLWNEHTRRCRGLIVDGGHNIKARCFEKFFNYEEVPNEVSARRGQPFEVSEKMDGSLGIIYWSGDTPFVATRGSFESKQALRATEILRRKYGEFKLDPSLTYLLEIIYPENRICVNYGGMEDLVFLAAMETDSGLEVDPPVPFPVAERFPVADFSEMKALNLKNREGYVVRFSDGFRFKIKFEEYVRLHGMIFSTSSKTVWSALREEREVSLHELPDELHGWVKACKDELVANYSAIESEASSVFSSIKGLPRKDFAARALEYSCSRILFGMLDGKPYGDMIWRMVEPEYKTPHYEEIQEG
jgi:RNA ligase